MHDGASSFRGRPSFLSGWFRRPSALPRQGVGAPADRLDPGQANGGPGSQASSPTPLRLLFLSSTPDETNALPTRLRAAFAQVEVVTRLSAAPLVQDDAAMAAIIVDCRSNDDAIMRIRGELDLLACPDRPLMVPMVRATRADKAWAMAIGADSILCFPYDETDLALLVKVASHSAELHRENARLRGNLDEASRDAQGLRTLAYTDHLTGLPNRLYLVTWLNEIIARHDTELQFAVHMLDLDGFKQVNDRYGHRAGDEILRQSAKRVTKLCRRLDLVVRLGGDEIVIVQAGVISTEDCKAFTSRLLQTFQTPFIVDDIETGIGASIGSAIYPADGATVSELLHHADLAMYAVKPPGMDRANSNADRSARLLADRQDMERGRFVPAFNLQTGLLSDALCIGQHPDQGADTAEASDTEFQPLRLACLQSAHRPAEQAEVLFAARIGQEALARDDLLCRLRDLLTDTGAEPNRCEIVVGGSDLDRDPALWHQIRELGYRLGVLVDIDDFSPQRLLRVPLTRLHLGASFLRAQPAASDGRVLLDMAVMFAHAIVAGTIAHGITNAGQAKALRDAGVGSATGPRDAAPLSGIALASLRHRAAHDWEQTEPVGGAGATAGTDDPTV